MKRTTLEFLGYLHFIKGYDRDYINCLTPFQLIMEQDDFEKWKLEQINYDDE